MRAPKILKKAAISGRFFYDSFAKSDGKTVRQRFLIGT
jgi:hypothetical protein